MATRRRCARRPQTARRSARRSPLSAGLLGWVAAGGVLLALAFVIGGPGAEQAVQGGTPSPSQGTAPLQIRFGTGLDPETNRAVNRTRRFRGGDPFAYSVTLPGRANTEAIFVEVTRLEDGGRVVVQQRARQEILPELRTFAFQVRTEDLLAAWGAGTYEMRIFLDGGKGPLAIGQFTLIATPSGS